MKLKHVSHLLVSFIHSFNKYKALRFSQFSLVSQSSPILWDTMDCIMPSLPVHHQLPEMLKVMPIQSVMPSNHLILCCPLLLLPSIFPSIRVFSIESALQLFALGGQNIRALASTSVLPTIFRVDFL